MLKSFLKSKISRKFFFRVIALIAVAGLPDKKLRKYIRQIGENQNAIDPEGSNNLKKIQNILIQNRNLIIRGGIV